MQEQFSGEIHPVANLFPMLGDDELKELADDIKERGLLQPIVLSPEGQLIDGRNRLSACNLAGVTPVFVTYEGDDPGGYALAANIQRRNLTKGQIAMVAARANSLLNKEFGAKQKVAEDVGVSPARISQAASILQHAPDLADAVVSGAMPLNAAYETAQQRKRAAESTDTQMARLREVAPDLAAQVTEETLSLGEAVVAERERERQRQEDIQVATSNLTRGLSLLDPGREPDPAYLDERLAMWRLDDVNPAAVRRTGMLLLALASQMEDSE